MIDWLRRALPPERRVTIAAWCLVAAVIAWPVTALTIFASEPQGILGLSWGAIILTFLQILLATDIRREQEGD